jgi:hypothetical protein
MEKRRPGRPPLPEGPKSDRERQAETKARREAAGLRQRSLWVHIDALPVFDELKDWLRDPEKAAQLAALLRASSDR